LFFKTNMVNNNNNNINNKNSTSIFYDTMRKKCIFIKHYKLDENKIITLLFVLFRFIL